MLLFLIILFLWKYKRYVLSDGTNREESGSLKQVGEVQAQTAQGVITWTSPEGQVNKNILFMR